MRPDFGAIEAQFTVVRAAELRLECLAGMF